MSGFESIANKVYARKARETSSRGRRLSVMIVDDNQDVIEALRQVLEGKYNVVACSSPAEAERRLSEQVDVVLLDVKMAPLDGFEVFARLRRRDPRVRIIFNTAYPGDSDAIARLRGLESDGYLTKSEYSAEELEEAIERAIARTRGGEHEGSERSRAL